MSPKKHKPTTWTVTEVAREWGVTPRRVQQWIQEGALKAYMRGGIYFIPKTEKRPPDRRKKQP